MAAGSTARRRPVLTGRALVLGALVVLLVVLLASPIHRYLGSRSDAARASQQLHDDQSQLAQLTQQQQMWGDPGYIQQQARARLEYAMPGDTVYVVVRNGQRSDIQKSTVTPGAQPMSGAWTQRLMDSIRAANK
jgi:cell division protein FtsB